VLVPTLSPWRLLALSCMLGMLVLPLGTLGRYLLYIMIGYLALPACILLCCVWSCTSWRCVRVPLLLLVALWAPMIVWCIIDSAGCDEGDPWPYPQLMRGEMERWREQTGSYPRTAAELALLAGDHGLPPVPPVFTPEFLQRCEMGTYGFYSGDEAGFSFVLDWGFMGPLGATFNSGEDGWRHYS